VAAAVAAVEFISLPELCLVEHASFLCRVPAQLEQDRVLLECSRLGCLKEVYGCTATTTVTGTPYGDEIILAFAGGGSSSSSSESLGRVDWVDETLCYLRCVRVRVCVRARARVCVCVCVCSRVGVEEANGSHKPRAIQSVCNRGIFTMSLV
jgi:hypothetical protein